MTKPPSPSRPDLETLIALFYDDADALGQMERVEASEMPAAYRRLLAHDSHMTVTVERFHNSPVNVRVLDERIEGSHYARKILLARAGDGQVVQFGLMRVNFAYVDDAVEREIRSRGTPLGRVLIEHNVLRRVRLSSLWRVQPGTELAELFDVTDGAETYGRTAMIEVGGDPAVELLEIVIPVLE